jgi:hypothetical protein
MTGTLAALAASVDPSVLDYVTPWHDLTKSVSSGASSAAHIAWLAALVLKALWIFFMIPNLLAFIDALRRPEQLYPRSTGYSKTLWAILLGAGFMFAISWIVVPLYLFLVFLPARRHLDVAPTVKAPAAEPPSRPFK